MISDDNISEIMTDVQGKIKNDLVISTLGDPQSLTHVTDFVSSGCIPLDIIFGGGFPMRRYTEIFGDNSTGKTLLAAQAVIEMQHMGGLCIFADVESAVSLSYFKKLGADENKLIYYRPSTIGEVFESLENFINSKNEILSKDYPMLFVWDSIAATTTSDELKSKYEDRGYPAAAMQLSKSLRRITRIIADSNVCAIFINQTRQNIGVMYGSKVSTFGGQAVGFYASMRLQLKTKKKHEDERGNCIGIDMEVYTFKNKIAPPFRKLEIPIFFNVGTDDVIPMLNLLLSQGIVNHKKGASWYDFVDTDTGELIKFRRKDFEGICNTHYDKFVKQLNELMNG